MTRRVHRVAAERVAWRARKNIEDLQLQLALLQPEPESLTEADVLHEAGQQAEAAHSALLWIIGNLAALRDDPGEGH